MFTFKENPVDSNSVLIYKGDEIALRVSKSDYPSDDEAFLMAEEICNKMNWGV